MIIPVRCFSCGKVIANKWEKYKQLLTEEKTKKEALDIIGFKRYCCRSIFMCHVELIDDLLRYDKLTSTNKK